MFFIKNLCVALTVVCVGTSTLPAMYFHGSFDSDYDYYNDAKTFASLLDNDNFGVELFNHAELFARGNQSLRQYVTALKNGQIGAFLEDTQDLFVTCAMLYGLLFLNETTDVSEFLDEVK